MTKGLGLEKAVNGDKGQGAARLQAKGEDRRAPESTAPVFRDKMAKVASEQVPEQKQHKQMQTDAYCLSLGLRRFFFF